ncbi:hypothetical protein E3N88_44745 [Mikania micrantha]|uniref:Ionotropic glutamate receptor C-terminal domain-containing protein n=1 Tax=Mikania micrantha TaxID=192012 RepID=A0A5N6LBD1_9ASTR|nr:hypothetical protein E3N88_44745 [Mikania micrantha]
MESWIGRSIHRFVTFAITDFYEYNNDYSTRIFLHTRDSKGDPLQALLAAKLLAPIADKAKVPMFSFAGSPSMEYPFLFQIKEDELVMSKSNTALVDSFGWREVILLYEDIDCGREILSYFLESFQDKSIRVSHTSAVLALSTDDQITQELQKIKISNKMVIVVHMSSLLLASKVLLIAKRLGMVNEEYAWIVTYNTIDILQQLDNEVTESSQGVISLSLASIEVSVFAIWAYDTIWALAETVQKLGVQFSFVVTQMELMLQHELSKTSFKGVTGEFRHMGVACSALPYEVPYELVPFPNGTYDDLIKKVYVQEIDVILGDSTIYANRSEFIDFTATYTEIGIGTLARINHNDMWIFLKPLDVDLWLITVAFAILTGFVLSSNLARFVEFVWLFVVLILITSYTATLTSLLTVEQFELASKGETVGFHGGSFVAGRTVNNVHLKNCRHRPYYSYEDYAEALSKGGKHGGADAIIDEIPNIKMFLGLYSADYAMISSEPTTSGFAFIFQKGSPLVMEMSRQIAKLREEGTLRLLEKKWFEKQSSSSSSQDSPPKPKTLNFSRFRGMVVERVAFRPSKGEKNIDAMMAMDSPNIQASKNGMNIDA